MFPMHPATDNSRGSSSGPNVFPEIRAGESCGFRFSAVKYGRAKAPPCYALRVRYPLLFMSEYSKTLTLPSIPCHSVELRSASSFNCLFKRPLVVLAISECAELSVYVCAILLRLVSRDNRTTESVVQFRKEHYFPRNVRKHPQHSIVLFTHNYIINILLFIYINIC